MNIWQRKLLAFLHDPPHKPFRVAGHENAVLSILRHLGLAQESIPNIDKQPDWWAAAADRFPFPRASVLNVDWKRDGGLEFRHPLSGVRWVPPNQPREDSDVGEKWIEDVLHGLPVDDGGWKQKYFRLWRFWMEIAAREKNPLLAYLVADTRIPDHTLWHHNALVSSLEGTDKNPAFLLFQIGPVQDFIAQARSMRDLWSGSYLLSFLISKAESVLALEYGPDTILYPNLRAAPLLDWWWSKENSLFPEGTFTLGEGRLHPSELLTPSLPNRFLAILPADKAETAASLAKQAIQNEWRRISDAVYYEICKRMGEKLKSGWDTHWASQVDRFPTIDFVVYRWIGEKDTYERFQQGLIPLHGGWNEHPLKKLLEWKESIPKEHRETWHGEPNIATAWALHYAVTDWLFNAQKNSRGFQQWVVNECLGLPKDHLNGRDEVIGGSDADGFWKDLRAAFGGERGDFKGRQQYGAINIIKRLWPEAYLNKHLNWKVCKPTFDSVSDLALIESDLESDSSEDLKSCGYYAVLCMDGDDMGQWVSGYKTTLLANALADKAFEYVKQHWKGQPSAEELKRPLTPGFHAALSEALSNFSLYGAGQVVEAFGGQLLYAGGDDVLAMLPAQSALDCAFALHCVYRGEVPEDAPLSVRQKLEKLFEFYAKSPGFLRCLVAGKKDSQRPNWPLLMPGNKATASVGIAIGHVHDPMQDTIQAAREAEHEAKRVKGKAAFSLSVLKRSGDAVSFRAPWASGVLAIWSELFDFMDATSRFPYRYASLVKSLVVVGGGSGGATYADQWTTTLREAVELELRYALKQHTILSRDKASQQAKRWASALTSVLSPKDYLHFWLAWAFIRRLSKGVAS